MSTRTEAEDARQAAERAAAAEQDAESAKQASVKAPGSIATSEPDDQRLLALAAERSRVQPAKNYLVGAGDLLEVNVFDLPEMNRRVRVAASGYIQLPLLGAVKATGRSESALAQEIAQRLRTNYLQNPQVDVFVDEYKSQQVGVTGSVAKPGLYPLTRDRYTILDMISEAGGLTKDAGAVIEFVPAERSGGSAAFEMASAGGQLSGAPGADRENGISIDLNDLVRGANRTLNLAVTAGDVIYVPEAGSFTIEGWVDKPGTYPITRRMTVLAALSAGGGALLPSRLGRVEILRANGSSGAEREIRVVDLNAIREGKEPDTELRSGDIVRVPAWKTLVVPWGIYSFVKSLISIGASIPII